MTLYKLRIRESEKLKTVLELYNMEIHQKKAGPDYRRLKTVVKRSIEQKHSRILFQDLLRGRMREMHRGPEVPEARVPVAECLDGLARITLKELAMTHSVNMASSRMLVLQDQEWLQIW